MNYNIQANSCQAIIDELNIRKRTHGKIIDDLCKSFSKLDKATEEKEKRIKECGSMIILNEKGQIVSANFCKNRYCPICQWRKSRKAFALAFNIQQHIEDKHDHNFIFLTLTLKNVKNLSSGIDHILESFKRLQDTQAFRRTSKGFFRTLEITYNHKTKEWHPHIHTIVAVPYDYFINEKYYIDIEQWRNLWKTVAHVDYLPQCHVEKIKEEDREKAIAEISKYMVKPLDLELSQNTEEIYTQLLKSTFGRRLSSLGGVYREAHGILKKQYDEELQKEAEKEFRESEELLVFEYFGESYINSDILIKNCNSQEKVSKKGEIYAR